MVDWWLAVIGATIPAVVVQQAIKSSRKSVGQAKTPHENEKFFFCERVCTSQRMLNKLGGASKDLPHNTCVTVCGASELDSCTDACTRAVCANDYHLPNWNDVCLRRCQNQCLKLRSRSSN